MIWYYYNEEESTGKKWQYCDNRFEQYSDINLVSKSNM